MQCSWSFVHAEKYRATLWSLFEVGTSRFGGFLTFFYTFSVFIKGGPEPSKLMYYSPLGQIPNI